MRSDISKVFSRISLGAAFLIAVTIPVAAFIFRGPNSAETWTVAAAALAVITSVISAWSSRRLLELQEDAQRPDVYPSFDFQSRHQVALLRVTNTGASAAYNVSLEWETDLRNQSKAPIGFFKTGDLAGISNLLPGQSITQFINVHHEFIANHPKCEYRGKIYFEDISGKSYVKNFILDGRQYASTPSYDKEESRTHYQLQKIPDELKQLRELLQKLMNTNR